MIVTEVEINKLIVHHWHKEIHKGQELTCDYWDCPHKIKDDEVYYVEEYPEGQCLGYCLECSSFFLAQAVNTMIEHFSGQSRRVGVKEGMKGMVKETGTGRRDFLKLPIEERRKILARQAQDLADNIADSQAKDDLKMME